MTQNKIINFPLHKIKNKILPNYTSAPLSTEQKRLLIATLLMSVFLVVTIINTNTFSNIDAAPQARSSRDLASIAVRMPNMTSSFEKSIIAKYTSEASKSPVHIGGRPSKIEGLAFGALSGSYLIGLDSGKVSSIRVADKKIAQRINSAGQFLEQYKAVFAINYKTASKTFEKQTSESKQEEFDLIDAQNQRVGIATFTFDKAGYFISLQIEKQQAVAGL